MHSSTAYKVGRTNAGHTMVEVITAIALLGIFTMGFMQIHLWGMRATREAQQELAVSRYLYNELEAWRVAAHSGLTPTNNAAPRALCDEATTLEDFRATVDIAPAPSGPAGLFKVQVQVAWLGPGARPMKRETTTLCIAGEAKP